MAVPFIKIIQSFFDDLFDKVHEINEKYKNPRIKMTPWVKATLFFLRLYLVFLVVVLLYKFATIVTSPASPAKP